MQDQYIYLVFTKTGTWLSRLINLFSDTKYVHASISFDPTFREMYSFGRTNPNNPFSGGLVEENLHDGVYKKFSHSECLIYRVKVSGKQMTFLKKEIEIFLAQKEKYRYNFLGLFGVLLNKPLKRRHHYFCSQFVYEILIKSNIFKLNKAPELVKTTDLFLIENKELIYKGYIRQYHRLEDVIMTQGA
ncbi:hypothetical protein [Alkaliphilus crotonatoxidans]